jgi:cytoskeletal protein CcmA (bactofilin family)
MAMFAKEGKPPTEARAATTDASLTIIAAGVHLVGDLEGPGLIKVDGRVEGSISGARQVILGRDANVQGNVHATEVVVAGSIDGSVLATDRVEVQGSAVVNGDVHTRVIVVHEGAKVNGTVRMGVSAAPEVSERPSVQVMR